MKLKTDMPDGSHYVPGRYRNSSAPTGISIEVKEGHILVSPEVGQALLDHDKDTNQSRFEHVDDSLPEPVEAAPAVRSVVASDHPEAGKAEADVIGDGVVAEPTDAPADGEAAAEGGDASPAAETAEVEPGTMEPATKSGKKGK